MLGDLHQLFTEYEYMLVKGSYSSIKNREQEGSGNGGFSHQLVRRGSQKVYSDAYNNAVLASHVVIKKIVEDDNQ